MRPIPRTLRAPRPSRLLRELAVVRELPRLARGWSSPVCAVSAPRTVVVVPGFMTTDASTYVIRRALQRAGHRVHGWGLGRNRGDVPALIEHLRARVEALRSDHPIHLIGWSLGGYLAREVARDRPARVAQVITLGSPVIGGPKYTAAAAAFRDLLGADLDAIEREVVRRDATPLAVPVTALYSERDAVVCPAACIDHHNPMVEHVAVNTTHVGFCLSAEVLAIISARLNNPPTPTL